jgi:hypothetical protein
MVIGLKGARALTTEILYKMKPQRSIVELSS